MLEKLGLNQYNFLLNISIYSLVLVASDTDLLNSNCYFPYLVLISQRHHGIFYLGLFMLDAAMCCY